MKQLLLLFLLLFVIINVSAQTGREKDGYFENLSNAIKFKSDVKHLNLIHQNLKTFPKEILEMENLEFLDLSHNQLSTVPEEIHRLKNLKQLYINNNQLIKLPVSLRSMTQLEVLYVQVNPVNEEPELVKMFPQTLRKLEAGNPPADHVAPVPQRK